MHIHINIYIHKFIAKHTHIQIWINEKFAPDILDHQMEIVDCMLEQIEEQESNLDSARSNSNLRKGDLRISLHTLEVSDIVK